METLDFNNFYHRIYTSNCAEFEEIRTLCLQENNWLRENYIPQNLDLTMYNGYAVIFEKHTDEPVAMAGAFNPGRYPKNVAQHLHRQYLFPKFRRKTYYGLVQGFSLYHEHIIKPLNLINNYDTYFIAMQNRYKKSSKGYWEVFSKALCEAMPGWTLGAGYLQTCQADVQKCWQNYCYYGNWDSWDKKILTQEEWDQLIEGD